MPPEVHSALTLAERHLATARRIMSGKRGNWTWRCRMMKHRYKAQKHLARAGRYGGAA